MGLSADCPRRQAGNRGPGQPGRRTALRGSRHVVVSLSPKPRGRHLRKTGSPLLVPLNGRRPYVLCIHRPTSRGDEMSESPKTSAMTQDVIQDAEPGLAQDEVSQAPVLVTEQEVMLSTAAAAPPRPTTITRRLIDTIRVVLLIEAIRVVGAALQPPPARRHHPPRFGYLEQARMAREMDRL